MFHSSVVNVPRWGKQRGRLSDGCLSFNTTRLRVLPTLASWTHQSQFLIVDRQRIATGASNQAAASSLCVYQLGSALGADSVYKSAGHDSVTCSRTGECQQFESTSNTHRHRSIQTDRPWHSQTGASLQPRLQWSENTLLAGSIDFDGGSSLARSLAAVAGGGSVCRSTSLTGEFVPSVTNTTTMTTLACRRP